MGFPDGSENRSQYYLCDVGMCNLSEANVVFAFLVGASMLAIDVNDNAGCLKHHIAWTFFASRLAPAFQSWTPRNHCVATHEMRSAPHYQNKTIEKNYH